MELGLYCLSLKKSGAVTAAALGVWQDSPKVEYLVLARGSWLEVYCPHEDSGKLILLSSSNTFSTIRCLEAFQLTSAGKHYLLATADTGALSVLEWSHSAKQFKPLYNEPFGRSGLRRSVAGEYLAADATGRAVMVAAIEKSKLVFVLNKSQDTLTINSAIECPSTSLGGASITYALVGLDTGYSNPVWAAIEATNTSPPTKRIAYYELDLGLNHVRPAGSRKVPWSSNRLIALKGGLDGPSGVLVCSAGQIQYCHPDQASIAIAIPSNKGDVAIVSSAVLHKMQDSFFVLFQTQKGHLFKLEFGLMQGTPYRLGGGMLVDELRIEYFQTITPAHSLYILKAGFLFAAAERGDHLLYQFNSLGSDDPSKMYRVKLDDPEDEPVPITVEDEALNAEENLSLVDLLSSLNPLTCARVTSASSKDPSPVIYVGSGTELKSLEYGLPVKEYVSFPGLTSEVHEIFSLKSSADQQHHSLIVLSSESSTTTLAVGDSITEVKDSGFNPGLKTLGAYLLGSCLVQVTPGAVLAFSSNLKINWNPQVGVTIIASAATGTQMLVLLSNNELVYMELSSSSTALEFFEKSRITYKKKPVSLAIAPVAKGLLKSLIATVGFGDGSLRILSLDPRNLLSTLSLQGLSSAPFSMLMQSSSEFESILLHVGLDNGIHILTQIDGATGELSNARTRYMGPAPVKMCEAWSTSETNEIRYFALALCVKPWLCKATNSSQNSYEMTPLAYSRLSASTQFSSPSISRAMIAVAGKSLLIFSLDDQLDSTRQKKLDLQTIPRVIALNTIKPFYYVLCFSKNQSCISIVDPGPLTLLKRVDLPDGLVGLAACNCRLKSQQKEFFIVSAAIRVFDSFKTGIQYREPQILVYEYTGPTLGQDLMLVHSTPLSAAAKALTGFQGILLVGAGAQLTLYDMGMKRLLRKGVCQSPTFRDISVLKTVSKRVYVGDSKHSVTLCVFDPQEMTFLTIVDDPLQRSVVCMSVLDVDTVAVGDKFGTVCVLRCASSVSDLTNDAVGYRVLSAQKSSITGCPFKFETLCTFNVNDTPTHLQKHAFLSSGTSVLVYSGILGSLGAMIPFESEFVYRFFQKLELSMRKRALNLFGRDHIKFRGLYAPPSHVIDGDFCESFSTQSADIKEEICRDLETSVKEVERRLVELRVRNIY